MKAFVALMHMGVTSIRLFETYLETKYLKDKCKKKIEEKN